MDIDLKTEQRRGKFRRWYVENREVTSQKRRKRYANDPIYRAKIKKQALSYRKDRMKGHTVERTLHRTWRGVPLQVFTSGHVIDEAGCTYYQLREWEDRGWVPAPVFPDRHRLYLKHQVTLIKALSDALQVAGGNTETTRVKKALTNLQANWGTP